MSVRYFDDCKKRKLPSGLKTFGEIFRLSDEKNVKDFWFRNGARLVCESIAGVGAGRTLNVNVNDMLLPNVEQRVREVYGKAYRLRTELQKIMDEYDNNHYSLIKG